MTATERLLDALRQHGTVRGSGRQHMATCPAHEDRSPSLSVTSAETRVLVKCQAGCETDDVLSALNLSRADLYDEPIAASTSKSTIAAAYDYVGEDGGLLYQVVRLTPKTFRQRRPDGSGWRWNLNGTPRVLYHLPDVVAAVKAGETVYVVEGEKDADRIAAVGAVATTNPGGAGKWRPEYGDVLVGAVVVVVADRDEPGMAHAAQVAADLDGRAASVRVVQAVAGKDASDHLAAGHGVEDFEPYELADEDALARELDAAAEFAREVDREAFRLRVREAGREKLASEKSATVALPALTRLDQFLAIPDEDVTYRVDRLWPVGGRVVLAAQHKAGKSTLVANLVRALVDAEPFLDAFGVAAVGRVVVVDDELDERMLRRWLRDQGIRNTDRVTVVPLRGRLSSFNVLDPATRTRWAEHLGRADVLIFDCLRPALDALGLSEDKEAGRFLEALDELATEAGIPEVAVVHHMGHQGERSRGDSRILDWPDAVWRLVKDAEDEETGAGQVRRYLTAYGRDVDVPESLLAYDPATRRLSVAGGTRSDRKADASSADVVASMADHGEPLSGRAIEERMADTEHSQKSVRASVRRLVEAGQVEKQPRSGRGGGFLYSLSASSASGASEVRQRGSEKCVSASIDAQRTHYADDEIDQVGQQRTSGPLDDTNRGEDDHGEDGKGSGQPGKPSRWDQLDDSTEAPPPCPSCLHQTAGPPGRNCNAPDLHSTGVML